MSAVLLPRCMYHQKASAMMIGTVYMIHDMTLTISGSGE